MNWTHRSITRRNALKTSMVGAGAAAVGAVGGGFLTSGVSAQEDTQDFDRAACYVPFEGSEPVQYDSVGEAPFNLALSNGYIGNVWRTQMINMADVFVTQDDVAPLVSDWQVASSGEDVAAQISQTENMISAGAQAIIINAISPTALTPTVERARQEGIVIVAFDNIVEASDIAYVNQDQVEMGRTWAQFLVDEAGESGKILMINGVAGTSVDQDRQDGAKEVFDQFADIELVEVVGQWDPGTAQTVTANALTAHDDITGVWCQGGTDGAVRAFLAADRPLVPFAGEAENGFRKQMLEYADEMPAVSIGQSPGLVAVSIRVALDLLQGMETPSKIAVPNVVVTTADLEPGVNVFPDAPDNFFTPINIDQCGVNFTYEEVAPE